MKIFALYSKLELIEKPDWLDEFYVKYNRTNIYHVTLKQSCYLEEGKVQEIKERLSAFFATTPVSEHEIVLTFSNLALDNSSSQEKTIMLNADPCPRVHELQRGILLALDGYKEYVYPESYLWEKSFKPHITLASDISVARYEEALKELKQPYACKGLIQDVSLIIVERMIPEEADKPENQTIYPL